MRVAILLLTIVLAVSAAPKISYQKIVGGSLTTIGQYPYNAALLESPNSSWYGQICGGTILNNRSYLTAAHCFLSLVANRYRIRVGSTNANSGGVVHNVAQIIRHNQYSSQTLNNDIAILRLSSTVTFNNNVRAASIAGSNYNLADNQPVWAVGWGRTSQNGPVSEQLRHVQVWVVNQTLCRTRYLEVGSAITDNMLCAGWIDVGGRDACSGDSGGPLIHNGIVVGVCSFGVGCAQARYPGVNARVSRYTSWIQSNA